MRARLLTVDVPDAFGSDLASYRPPDPERFSVLVDALIAPDDGDRGERFTFRVCSPAWLVGAQRARGFEFVQHTLLVDRWEPALVEEAIDAVCESSEGRDWNAVTQALSRFGRWEFEAWYPALGAAAV